MLPRGFGEIDREILEHRQQTNALIQAEMFLALTGKETYVNPFTGENELGSSLLGSERWLTPDGDVVYFDETGLRSQPLGTPRTVGLETREGTLRVSLVSVLLDLSAKLAREITTQEYLVLLRRSLPGALERVFTRQLQTRFDVVRRAAHGFEKGLESGVPISLVADDVCELEP